MFFLNTGLFRKQAGLTWCSLDRFHCTYIQSNLSYVTFHESSQIWSHKTGDCLIEVVTKAGLTVLITYLCLNIGIKLLTRKRKPLVALVTQTTSNHIHTIKHTCSLNSFTGIVHITLYL